MRHFRTNDEYEKELIGIINQLTGRLQKWQVWEYMITAMACSIANRMEVNQQRYEKREKEYAACIQQIGCVDLPARFLAVIVEALEANPDQDFLGSLYMRLELGSHWHGQFFTPYSVCKLMTSITTDKELMRNNWISACDPACGAGATLIAAANHMQSNGINYQSDVMFVGQDVDRIVGMMCYIQLSLIGAPGYICIANTLTNPIDGDVLEPIEKEGQEFWHTPFFFRNEWTMRRCISRLQRMTGIAPVTQKQKKERYTFFFEF